MMVVHNEEIRISDYGRIVQGTMLTCVPIIRRRIQCLGDYFNFSHPQLFLSNGYIHRVQYRRFRRIRCLSRHFPAIYSRIVYAHNTPDTIRPRTV